MRKICLTFLLIALSIFLGLNKSEAQLTPPGIGKSKSVFWTALGIEKSLDSAQKWNSMSYIGSSRQSTMRDENPFNKQAILVLNEEITHQISKHWSYSMALSYRRQNYYLSEKPFANDTPGLVQEFRLYGRLFYTWHLNKRNKMKIALRQELRKFYTTAFDRPKDVFGLRSRLKVGYSHSLDKDGNKQIITGAEELFSFVKNHLSEWDDFTENETRISIFYAFKLAQSPLLVHIGYMNDLLGLNEIKSVSYLALDCILKF